MICGRQDLGCKQRLWANGLCKQHHYYYIKRKKKEKIDGKLL
jgi:hypothetical protein